ncbi:MAG: acyl-CoA dehydrogenase family protein [Acidimicrobiales bacterium]
MTTPPSDGTASTSDASSQNEAPDSRLSRLPALVELLIRDAALVDESSVIPESHLAAFADAGLYGAAAPRSAGGLELDLDQFCSVVEELSAACLTTTFLWLQHFRLLGTLLDPATPPELRSMFPKVVTGQIRGGISLGGSHSGPPRLIAHSTKEGWVLNGESPWVSGWGIVDEIVVTSREGDQSVASFVLDARLCEGLTATPLHLSAMNASSTVTLTFSNVSVPHDRYVGSEPYAPGLERREGLRVNGSLSLGVTRRCCAVIGPSSLDEELVRAREELDHASAVEMPEARARAAGLAVRSAHALAISIGSRSAISGDIAERSTREASLLLVFGSRPAIKSALLARMFGRF